MQDVALIAIVWLVGLAFGSLVTALSWRIPRRENISTQRSRCTHCQKPLGPLQLVPLFSWLYQKGKCAFCGQRISPRYPIIELLVSLGFVGCFLCFGISASLLYHLALITLLMLMIVIDIEHRILPDPIQIILLCLGFLYHWQINHSVVTGVIGMVSALILALALKYGYLLIRKRDGLGLGDVKFIAVMGLWIDPFHWPLFFFLAGIGGVATGLLWQRFNSGPQFPFGPALAFAFFVTFLVQEQLSEHIYVL